MLETITAVTNPAVKRLKALLEAKGRKAENAFLVEGEVMIREALGSGLIPKEALFENESKLIDELNGVPTRLCSRRVLEAVCDTVTPQGAVCAFELPKQTLMPADARLMLALDGVQDPGNLGTILRTADAAGFKGAYLSEKCADVYSPKVQRAAMGSGFRIPTLRSGLVDTLEKLRTEGWLIVCSLLDGDPLYQAELPSKTERLILVIGNEARGISEEVQALADIKVKIPMRGRAESLNAAVAAGILMYELTRNL